MNKEDLLELLTFKVEELIRDNIKEDQYDGTYGYNEAAKAVIEYMSKFITKD